MAQRTCKVCGAEHPLDSQHFKYYLRGRGFFSRVCLSCQRTAAKVKKGVDYAANPEKYRARARRYYQEHTDICVARAAKNIDRLKELRPDLYAENKRRYNRNWSKTESGKRSLREKARRKLKRPSFVLTNRIKVRMRSLLRERGSSKGGRSWQKLVGYSKQDLIEHLERLFLPGMTWENCHLWHVDHIKPVSSFNYTKPTDPGFKQCWALANLQPLWGLDNIRKSNKT